MRFDSSWLNQYESRRAKPNATPASESSVSKESELHKAIIDECKRRGWIAFHGSMAHQTFRTEGEFDFTILADGGRVLLVECKTKTGKLSPEQAAIHHWAKKLGHQPHVVRSFNEFVELCQPQ